MQPVFITFGLHRQLAFVLRAALWMGAWFAIAYLPLSWAKDASEWNELAGEEVWPESFLRVHNYMWRAILVFGLYTVMGLLAAVAGKFLSLQFHQANHLSRLEVRRCSKAARASSWCAGKHGHAAPWQAPNRAPAMTIRRLEVRSAL